MANRKNTPIVFNKLCDIIKTPGIFSDISYAVAESGAHCVSGVVNDKAFDASGKTEKEAKDKFALGVFGAYGQDKPVKGKLMETKCIGQMLCWNALANVRNFRRRVITEYVGDEDGECVVGAYIKNKIKNDEGKFEFEREELMRATGPSIQDAEFNLGILMLNAEEYRDQYVAWIKSGRAFDKGWRQPEEQTTEEDVKEEGDTEEMDTSEAKSPKKKPQDRHRIEFVEVEPEEGEYVTKLRAFCDQYGLGIPTFLSGTRANGSELAQCKISLTAKDKNKEAACKVINDILLQICEEQTARRAEEKEARAAEAVAKAEEREAERLAMLAEAKAEVEAVKASTTLVTGWPTPKGGKPKKVVAAAAAPEIPAHNDDLAVYTNQMLQDAFGNLENFPLLALNDFIKANHTGKKVKFQDLGVAPGGGFHCEAEVVDVKTRGHGSSKKEAKQVAAQALIKTLQSAEPPAFEMNTATAMPVETVSAVVVPAAKQAAGNVNDNPVSRVAAAGNIFSQPVSWDMQNDVATKSFTCTVTFGMLTASGIASDKKAAKQNAAGAILPVIEGQFGVPEDVAAQRRAAKAAGNKRGRGGARGGRGGKRPRNQN